MLSQSFRSQETDSKKKCSKSKEQSEASPYRPSSRNAGSYSFPRCNHNVFHYVFQDYIHVQDILPIKAECMVCSSVLPKFYTHPVSMTVDEGGVARFQCEINGVPEANITWERNRLPLNTTDNR